LGGFLDYEEIKFLFMSELKYKEITEKIIGSAMKVHAVLGNGFTR